MSLLGLRAAGLPFGPIPGKNLGLIAAGAAAQYTPNALTRLVGQAVPGANGSTLITLAQATRNPLALTRLAGQALQGGLTNRALKSAAPGSGGIPGTYLAFGTTGGSIQWRSYPRYRAIAVVPTGETGPGPNGQTYNFVTPYQAMITVREEHNDELYITDHPVEYGASITDHAFLKPREVTITAMWSNSPNPETAGIQAVVGSALTPSTPVAPFGSGSDFIRNVYDALRAVQESRVPFTIFTGKRTYTNMLFSSLRVDTTPDTENALMLVAHCREIIIVSVQVTPIPQNSVQSNNGGGTGPASSTGNVLAAGSQSLQSAFGTVNANGVSNALGVPVSLIPPPFNPVPSIKSPTFNSLLGR